MALLTGPGWTTAFSSAAALAVTTSERLPQLRSTQYDGQFAIATLDEIIALVAAESSKRGRVIGLVPEVNRLGWTALLEAIILGDGGKRHQEIVGLLIAAGANVNLADNEGVTPLRHARDRGFDEIAALLEKAGAK